MIRNHKTNKHKAWISIIEKAYAIHRMIFQNDKLTENEHDKYILIENKCMFTEEEKKIKIKYNASSFYMESLRGGCGFHVFQHILNCQIHFQRIDDFETNLKDAEVFLTALNFINSEFVIKNILNKKIIWNNSLRILRTIFNYSLHDNTGYQVLKVMTINLIKHTKKIDDLFNSFTNDKDITTAKKMYSILSFLLEDDEILLNKAKAFCTDENFNSEQKLVNYIKDKLERNQLITIATDKIENDNKPGLRGPHAYQVINLVEDEKKGLSLVIRNPWGNTVRDYINENNKLTPIEVKNIKHHSKFNIFGLFETKKIPSITNNNVDKKKLATQIKTSGVFIMPIKDVMENFVRIDSTNDSNGYPYPESKYPEKIKTFGIL